MRRCFLLLIGLLLISSFGCKRDLQAEPQFARPKLDVPVETTTDKDGRMTRSDYREK